MPGQKRKREEEDEISDEARKQEIDKYIDGLTDDERRFECFRNKNA